MFSFYLETYGSNIETVTPHLYQTAHGSQIPDRQRYSYNSNSDYSSTQAAPPFNQQHFNQSSTGFGQSSSIVTKRPDNSQLNKQNKHDPNTIKGSKTQVTSMKNKENQLPSNKTQTQVVTNKKNIEPLQQSIVQLVFFSTWFLTFFQPRHAHENSSKGTESNLVRSEQIVPNPPPKRTVPPTHKADQPVHGRQSPTIMDQRTKPTHSHHHEHVEPVKKSIAPIQVETENQAQKPNRSSLMRAAAIRKLEEKREKKRQDAFFPSSENKTKPNKSKPSETTPETDLDYEDGRKTKTTKRIVRSHSYDRHRHHHHSDVEHSENEKVKPKKKHAHSVPRTRQTVMQNDDDQSEAEKIKSKQKKSKSLKKNDAKQRPPSDDEDYEMDKSKKSRKPSKKRQSRRDEHHDESSDDQQKHRSKSRKRTVVPDGHGQLPPIRRQGGAPIHPEHYRDRLRRGQPYFDEFYPPYGLYPSRYDYHNHLHEDAYDVPPYLAPYHDPYDPFFDYEKRKTQMKTRRDKNNSRTDRESNGTATGYETERDERANSNQTVKHKKNTHKQKSNGHKSRPEDTQSRRGTHVATRYYPEDEALDLWRQERNDYLKGKFKPTVHDVLYAQQWMKAGQFLIISLLHFWFFSR